MSTASVYYRQLEATTTRTAILEKTCAAGKRKHINYRPAR